MSPALLLERLRSWTETGIAASPHYACREIRESADEIERLRVELIKVWDGVNELRRRAQNLERLIAAAIQSSDQNLDRGCSHLEMSLHSAPSSGA